MKQVHANFLGTIQNFIPADGDSFTVTVNMVIFNNKPVERNEEFTLIPQEDPHVGDLIQGTVVYNPEDDSIQSLVEFRIIRSEAKNDKPSSIMEIEGQVTATLPPFDEDNHHVVALKVNHIADTKFDRDWQVVIITTKDLRVGDIISYEAEFDIFGFNSTMYTPELLIGGIGHIDPIEETNFSVVECYIRCIGDATKPKQVLSLKACSTIIMDNSYALGDTVKLLIKDLKVIKPAEQ